MGAVIVFMLGAVLGAAVGFTVAIAVVVVLALRTHEREEAARFTAETTMADIRGKALRDGRLVEPRAGAVQ